MCVFLVRCLHYVVFQAPEVRIPDTKDDLPELDTPQTAVIQPSGNCTFTDCRLLCFAPLIVIFSFFGSFFSQAPLWFFTA